MGAPTIGQAVRVRGLKPGWTDGLKGTVLSVRADDRANILLTADATARAHKAIASRGKPWQSALLHDGPDGCAILPAVPLGNLAAG
jgi:hypothetical protein